MYLILQQKNIHNLKTGNYNFFQNELIIFVK